MENKYYTKNHKGEKMMDIEKQGKKCVTSFPIEPTCAEPGERGENCLQVAWRVFKRILKGDIYIHEEDITPVIYDPITDTLYVGKAEEYDHHSK